MPGASSDSVIGTSARWCRVPPLLTNHWRPLMHPTTTSTNEPQRSWREAWLLIAPGSALIGVGVGLLFDKLVEGSLVGVGLGTLVWGLIVALRR